MTERDAPWSGLVEVPPVRFQVTRRGSGPALVLVHGLSGSSRWWDRNVEELAQHHEVVTVDLVGFGANRGWRGSELPLPFDDAASVLGRWLAASFPGGVHLVGHSMGGQISILVAATFPEVVRSLILVGSTGVGFRVQLRRHLRNALASSKATLRFGPVVARDFWRAGPTAVALAAAHILRSNATEAMEALSLPTLLVWGERDPLVPETYAESMLELIVGSRMELIPGAGHVPMWERPAEFNRAVVDFVREVESSARPPGWPARRRAFQWGIDDVHEGICWRSSGPRPEVMLVHGLGITSAYYQPLARELHRRGLESLAVDQPGYGWSQGNARDPREAVASLIAIAELHASPPLVWVGHSTGCQLVEMVRQKRPDLVQRAIHLSPIWSHRRDRFVRLIAAAAGDAVRESPELVLFAIATYLRGGLWSIGHAMAYYVVDAARPRQLAAGDTVIVGEEDPMIDREHVAGIAGSRLQFVRGAHGMHFRYPEDVAERVVGAVSR